MYAKPMRALIHALVATTALPMTGIAADDGSHSGDSAGNTTAQQMGEHPAVLVFRNWDPRSHDYAPKLHLHAAWPARDSVPPREMGEHPAVAIAKTWRIRGYEEATNMASHPALLPRALPAPPAEPGLAPDGTAGYVPVAAKRSANSGSAR